VVDQTSLRRSSDFESLIECCHGERSAKPFCQGPADSASGEGVEDHGEIGKGSDQIHIGDFGHPDLIRT